MRSQIASAMVASAMAACQLPGLSWLVMMVDASLYRSSSTSAEVRVGDPIHIAASGVDSERDYLSGSRPEPGHLARVLSLVLVSSFEPGLDLSAGTLAKPKYSRAGLSALMPWNDWKYAASISSVALVRSSVVRAPECLCFRAADAENPWSSPSPIRLLL